MKDCSDLDSRLIIELAKRENFVENKIFFSFSSTYLIVSYVVFGTAVGCFLERSGRLRSPLAGVTESSLLPSSRIVRVWYGRIALAGM